MHNSRFGGHAKLYGNGVEVLASLSNEQFERNAGICTVSRVGFAGLFASGVKWVARWANTS